MELMPFSSASHKQNQALDAFSGIEPPGVRREVCESCRVYDVFINHRGPDVKQTLATELYNSLEQLGIRVFLDSQEKELGNSFASTIEAAIRSSKVHIAIFSPRYAESAWCLAELVLMLETQSKIIPVFYEVKPSDLRRIERGAYANAFVKYKKEGRYDEEKLNAWKEALLSLSYIAGEEFSSFSVGQCQKIVEAVQKEVQVKTSLHVAEYPVGLHNLVEDFERHFLDELVEDFEVKCGLKNGSWDEVKMRNYIKSDFLFDVQEEDVGSQILSLFKYPFEKDLKGECGQEEEEHKSKVIGIFGMGGVGKSTLAKELFNRKKSNYKRASFLFDVREKCGTRQLPSLQRKLLRDLFNDHHVNFTLRDKCLLEIDTSTYQKPVLRMHDHLRDLGRELANEFSPPHRLWRPADLKSLQLKGFKSILSETNIRIFHSIFDKSMGCQVTFFLGQPNNRFENSSSLLWLHLERLKPPIEEQSHILSWIPRLNFRERSRSIPTWIPLQNLQCLKIQGEQLKTLWNKCIQAPSELKELGIFCSSLKEFPDFVENCFLENEGNSNGVKAPRSCLEKIEISEENCVSSILISGIHYPRLKSIKLHGMKNLQEVNLTGVNTLNCIDIENCKNLKKLTVRRMKLLESIHFDINEVLRYFELDDCQILKTIELDWNKLVELSIRRCPELPAFIGPCRIERIIINGKFECLELNGCRNLRSVLGNLEVSRLYVRDCPQLEELSVARVSCLDDIVIDSCEKLQNISGMDELHVSEYMRLCYCSNAMIRTCIHKLKSTPSDYTLVIGRAADGAKSTSNEYLFGDGNIGIDGVIETGTPETYLEWSALSAAAVIVCFVVEVDSSILLEDINESLQHYVYGYGYGYRYDCDYSIHLHEGEWIITMVAWDDWSYLNIMGIADVFSEKGIMKKGFRVDVKKGEEWKGLDVLRTVVDKLYDL